MAPRLCVPLTQSWVERNWKRASSGWSRTAPMVAKRVSTSTPLRGWVGFSVTDMWVPFEWVVRVGQAAAAAVPRGAGWAARSTASRSRASESWICSSTNRSGRGKADSARVRSKVSRSARSRRVW